MVYISLVDDNLGNDPMTELTAWTSSKLAATDQLNSLVINSANQVAEHWNECSMTFQDLQFFFTNTAGRGERATSLLVAYRDPSESWEEAYARLTKCEKCFLYVTHVAATAADQSVLYADTADQLSFATAVASDNKIPMFPTFDKTNLILSNTETSTIPAQAGVTGVNAAFFLTKDGCTLNCTDEANAAQSFPFYQPNHVMAAATAASYGFTGNWTLFMKPASGWNGARAHQLTLSEIQNVTGINSSGEFSSDATRSVNLYVRTEQKNAGFVDGLMANGTPIDVVSKRIMIQKTLIDTVSNYLHTRVDDIALSEASLSGLDATMRILARTFVNKGIPIDDLSESQASLPEFQWSTRYSNILAGGDGKGWVLARIPTAEVSDIDISNRKGVVYNFCYIPNSPLHRLTIQVCSTSSAL